MISNASCNTNTIAAPVAGIPPSAYPDNHASSLEAAEFSNQIAYLESRRTSETEAQEFAEAPDAIDGDVTDGASAPSRSDRHFTKNDMAIADVSKNVTSTVPLPLPIPAVDTPAMQQTSGNKTYAGFPSIGPIPMNEELLGTSIAPAAIARNAIEPAMPFASHGADVQHGETTSLALATTVNTTIGKGTNADGAIVPPSSGDMRALVGEFETSVNHFERSGNQWVGSAKIVFQSAVLHGASAQITGDGKSLNILLTQSSQSSPIALLFRQEKELCDTLTRRLGRIVTLHVQQTFETQAADDTESQ
jgi:hypothetical protein